MGSSFWSSFAKAAAPKIIEGLTGEDGNSKGVFAGYDKETENRFDKYIAERRQDVEAAYNSYKTDLDFWDEAATNLAYAVGEGTDPQNSLTGMEFAAQVLRGRTKSQAKDLVDNIKTLQDKGINIRDYFGDKLNRNDATQELRNLTANDVAKMQLGGGFKYEEKPFNLRENQSPIRRLLSDTFGLYKETDEAAAKKLMEKQREGIRGGLVDYDKVAGDTPFGEARQSLSLDPSMLRTKAEVREEQKSIYTTETARILNLNTTEEYALNARKRAEEHANLNREQLLRNAKTPQEKEAAIAAIKEHQDQQSILNADATAAATFANGVKESTRTINNKYNLGEGLNQKVSQLTEGQQQTYIKDIQLGRTQAMVNALFSVPQEAISLVQYGSFGAGGVSEDMFEAAKKHVQILRQGQKIAGSGASAYEKYMAGAEAVLGDSYNQETADVLAKQFLLPNQFVSYTKGRDEYKKRQGEIQAKQEESSTNASGVGKAVDTTQSTLRDKVAANRAAANEPSRFKDNLFRTSRDRAIWEGNEGGSSASTDNNKNAGKGTANKAEEKKKLAVPEARKAEPLVSRRSEQISEEEYNTRLLDTFKEEIRSAEGFKNTAHIPTKGDKPTIGFGFTTGVQLGDTMTKAQAEKRLDTEVKSRLQNIRKYIPDFNKFPQDVQVALFSSWYRGSLRGSLDTIDLINKGEYAKAAAEFLSNKEYEDAAERGRPGIRKRMKKTADALRSMA